MKRKKIILFAVSSVIALSICGVCASVISSSSMNEVQASNIVKYSYNSDEPFFESFYNDFEVDNVNSPDRWYETLPATTNTSNFCSLGTTTYENINGSTVTVDIFNRNVGESLNDPNFGQGILLYQALQYKIKHPTEEMYIDFASYRMSVTASTCVKRESKFFGYNRALFEEEYDDYGFVRFSFMLVEAARMGIHVRITPHLNSYAVKQYSATASSGYASRAEIQHREYFKKSLSINCYSKYANSKKVSDFFVYAPIDWSDSERPIDEQHSKFLAVSAYTDYQNVDHQYGFYTSSANLDTVDYLGRNGNGGSQSGSIITGHEAIVRCAHNYCRHVSQYANSQDSIVDFRYVTRQKNKEQVDLFNAGRANEIPSDEQILYMGSENDSVFEFYFTPFPGNVNAWDKVYNPFCRYFSEFGQSLYGPIVFSWTSPYHDKDYQFNYTFEDIISQAFHKNKNPQNRIYVHMETFNAGLYNDLKVGTDIGFKYINQNLNKYLHSKDIQMSFYSKDGTHKYINFLTSCNFSAATYSYQINQAIIIKETDENHGVFTTLGRATSYGCIV